MLCGVAGDVMGGKVVVGKLALSSWLFCQKRDLELFRLAKKARLSLGLCLTIQAEILCP